MSDYIKRADAIEAVCRTRCGDKAKGCPAHSCLVIEEFDALPSADAKPTVIRAKTFMRKEDFDKWAEDIKKQNKSIVCISCDAEVVSADADRPHGHWIRQDKYFQAFNETVTTYKCSVCGHEPYFGGDISKLNFCPNCGARMKGGDDE